MRPEKTPVLTNEIVNEMIRELREERSLTTDAED